jgi:hypothetical protein
VYRLWFVCGQTLLLVSLHLEAAVVDEGEVFQSLHVLIDTQILPGSKSDDLNGVSIWALLDLLDKLCQL